MLDIRLIRTNAELVKARLRTRHVPETDQAIDAIVELDTERRKLVTEVEELKHHRNVEAKRVGERKRRGEEITGTVTEMQVVRARIDQLDQDIAQSDQRLTEQLLLLPNLPHERVPVGRSAEDNRIVSEPSPRPRIAFSPKAHWDLSEQLGLADFKRGVKLSGARFYVLTGMGAQLERALINFMLETHVQRHGYTEVFAPVLLRPECLVDSGKLPKFGEDMFRIEQDDLWLSPTAEVPLTSLHREELFEPHTLPRKYACYSPCFRREAGAAGRETRGMLRVHQFNKVELVNLVTPETSDAALEQMVRDASEILALLALPYRTVQMCTGDLGFAAAAQYDLEVWMPGEHRWVEISSCSNCTDFQAQRATIRYRPSGQAPPDFVHTLNGSGVAVGRTFAAVLENYQQADGAILIPKALQPYLGGRDRIVANGHGL